MELLPIGHVLRMKRQTMTAKRISVATYRYDNTEALFDGSVAIDGVDATFHTDRIVTEIFGRMIRDQEFDVSELGWTYYLRTLDFDDPPFLALPVFPNRQFRHSAIYVNNESGIQEPKDLAGKVVGEFAMYGHDAGFWPKGILSDEFGVTPDQSRWVVGGLDWPLKPIDYLPFLHPDDVEVTRAPQGTDLGKMLDDGEIDALISADVPACVLNRSPRVRRLFQDWERTEREYFRRTKIFPAMHLVVVGKQFAADEPGLIRAVYDAFGRSRDAARDTYRFGRIFNNMDHGMVPWFPRVLDDNQDMFGDQWYAHGVNANRSMIDTALRYHFQQGLSRRQLTAADIFVPNLLDT